MRYTRYMRSHPLLSLLLLAGSLLFSTPVARAADEAPPNALETALLRKADKLSHGDKAAQHAKRVQILKALAAHITKVQKKEAGINDPVTGGSTALMLAVALGEKQTVRSLLAMGADPKKANDKGKNALDLAKDGKMREILENEVLFTSWEEAEKYFHTLITKKDNGDFFFTGENGKTRLYDGGYYLKAWETYDATKLIEVVSEKPGASRLLAFLANQPNVAPRVSSHANLLYIQRACDEGFITEEERDRQVAVLIPYVDINEGLRAAAQLGYLAFMRDLLSYGANPMKVLPRSHPDSNDEAFDKELLEGYGLPIGVAASNGHVDVVTWLFKQDDYTAVLDKLLVCSCFSPHPWSEKVEAMLLEKGAKFTPLCVMPAIMSGRAALVQQVLAATKPDKATLTKYLVDMVRGGCNSWSGNRCEVAKLLVQNGADIHVLEQVPPEPRHAHDDARWHAILGLMYGEGVQPWLRIGGVDLYETLIGLGLNEKKMLSMPIRRTGDDEANLLGRAAYHVDDGHMTAILLERGADPEAKAAGTKSALEFTDMRKERLWMLSVAAGKEMEASDEEKGKALGFAIATASVKLAEKMLRQGASIEQALSRRGDGGYYYVGKNGELSNKFSWREHFPIEQKKNKLMAVTFCSTHPLFKVLCNMKDKRYAKMLAWLQSQKPEMEQFVNATVASNETTLLMAVAMDKFFGLPNLPHVKPAPPEAVAWLLKHGADPTAKDKDGKTALDYATDKKKRAMLQAAMKKGGR